MKAGTHIVGGYVFAGTLCSFTDVNIFENEHHIIACAIFSILPDIDTTKSLIGKIFYPVSWLISRKLGHRTITHSLLFLIFVWALFYGLYRFEVIPNTDLLKVAVFSIFSHFVFDMITISGIPLLYPFYPNPCVIPGDVSLRLKSGDWKAESIVTGICLILCSSMQPLFANGFWTSYNRQFGTIKHVDRQNKNTEFYVICEYSYILNAETHTGEALVIDSKQNELILFDREKVFVLNSDNPQLKVNYTRPLTSTIEKRFQELQFFNISFDSLQNILSGKVASGLVQSNYNVRYIENAVTYYTNFIKFANKFDFRIYAGIDSSRAAFRTNIARLEASINQTRERHRADMQRYTDYQNSLRTLEDSLKNTSLTPYERNRLQQELIRLRNRPIEEPVYTPPASQIAELEAQRRAMDERTLLFSGHVTALTFGYAPSCSDDDDQSEPIPESERRPIYDSNVVFASIMIR